MAKQAHRGRRIDGIVLLDKPDGMTSNRALQRVKRLFDAAKAGHTGSLDPLATGMLPICLGEATKISRFLLDAAKVYRVAGRLGSATDTGDADGCIVAERAVPALDESDLRRALEGFVGESTQVPPMYSALKHQGQPLYKLARKGVEIERAPRCVTIHALRLERFRDAEFECYVHCSKGTYVRTLVADIAAALGTVGHVVSLRRLSVEPFAPAAMVTLEDLEAAAEQGRAALDELLLPSDTALAAWPSVELDSEAARKLQQGQSPAPCPSWPLGLVRIYGPGPAFIGVGDILIGGRLVSRRLFAPRALGDDERVWVK